MFTHFFAAGVAPAPDITNAAYASRTLDVNAEAPSATSIVFSTDGLNCYVTNGNDVYQYSLTTAWDTSTGSYASKTYDASSEVTGSGGIAFSADGKKMYLSDNITVKIYQYTLSTAWDVSTASYDSVSLDVSTEATASELSIAKNIGHKLFTLAGETVFQYSLSTPWDLSSASYDSKSFSGSSQDNQGRGFDVSADGKRWYLLGTTNDRLYQYDLSTAWDISTASYNSVNFDISSEATGQFGLTFKPSGGRFYMGGVAAQLIHEYTL